MTPLHPQQRRDRAISRTREEILHAAALTIGAKGYRGTTMVEIASAAGYTPPTLYSYFDSKAAIYAALLHAMRDEVLATIDEPMPSSLTFPQQLELLLWRQLDLAERRKEAVALFFSTAAVEADDHDGRTRHYADCEARISAWFREHAPKELAPFANDAACVLLGTFHAFVRRSLAAPQPAGPLRNLAPRLASLILSGLNGTAPSVVKKKLGR